MGVVIVEVAVAADASTSVMLVEAEDVMACTLRTAAVRERMAQGARRRGGYGDGELLQALSKRLTHA